MIDDGYAVGDALFVEAFDAIDARRGVEMLIVARAWRSAVLGASFK